MLGPYGCLGHADHESTHTRLYRRDAWAASAEARRVRAYHHITSLRQGGSALRHLYVYSIICENHDKSPRPYLRKSIRDLLLFMTRVGWHAFSMGKHHGNFVRRTAAVYGRQREDDQRAETQWIFGTFDPFDYENLKKSLGLYRII